MVGATPRPAPPGFIAADNAVGTATELDDFPHGPAATPGVSQVLVHVPIGPGELFIPAGGLVSRFESRRCATPPGRG